MSKSTRAPLEQLILNTDRMLRTLLPARSNGAQRSSPACKIEEASLSAQERRHAAGLMRVNHAGEVAAQALYSGHAAVTASNSTRAILNQAADEERDHLQWCDERLRQLGTHPSRLNPVWYAGSFALGALSGIAGDRWGFGFIEETERQVARHLEGHLEALPAGDARSRSIVTTMLAEEQEHGAAAHAQGAHRLPRPLTRLMNAVSRVMTRSAYWL